MPIRVTLLLSLLALLIFQATRVVMDAGLLRPLTFRVPFECTQFPGITGGEDITIDHARAVAFVSADDRAATARGQPVPGRIYSLSLDDPEPVLARQSPDLLFDFHPHGLSLFTQPDGKRQLYVINHRRDGSHWIEIFAVQTDDSLQHTTSIRNDLFISPNDLVVIATNRFYLTSDHRFENPVLRAAEDYLGLPLSRVIYFDGEKATVVATGLRFANGIAIDRSHHKLYVAETTGRRLRSYHVEADGSLAIAEVHRMESGIDNLEWDDRGRLWTAGHPRLLETLAHFRDPGRKAPSEVIRFSPEQQIARSILLDDGSLISGAAVAAVSGNTLLVGPVFDSHILRCKLHDDRPEQVMKDHP